jgi:hypothetical protein
MSLEAVPKPENPEFLDIIIVQIQDTLKEKLSWLNYSFGRCQKMAKTVDNKQHFFPAVHIGFGEYRSVFPDESLGNFSFVSISDPQEIKFVPKTFNDATFTYSLVFWLNLNKIFAGEKDRNAEAIKAQILSILTRQTYLTSGRITVDRIYEEAENIYKGYSIKEIETQFLTQPFVGFRFEGKMTLVEKC